MKLRTVLIAVFTIGILAIPPAYAGTRASPVSYKTHDGREMRGFIMQKEDVADDAPVAFLLHGMKAHMFHWIADGFPMYGGSLSDMLVEKGYRVIALDARIHGYTRKEGNPERALTKASLGMTSDYYSMIKDTVKDYEFILKDRLPKNFKNTRHVLVVGYSMGAQMGIMLAAENPEVTHLVTLVPPHTGRHKSVSPEEHAPKVKAKWLLITASDDEYASAKENDALEAAITTDYERFEFESEHVLPPEYVAKVEEWVSKIE